MCDRLFHVQQPPQGPPFPPHPDSRNPTGPSLLCLIDKQLNQMSIFVVFPCSTSHAHQHTWNNIDYLRGSIMITQPVTQAYAAYSIEEDYLVISVLRCPPKSLPLSRPSTS